MNQPANKMATRPVFPLLMSMALPPMFSMLLSSLYNIVDSMFVARYSADALTAVSLAFPLQNFALAVSVGAGVGISSYIARKLGEGDTEAVNSAVSHGLLISLIHYLLFVLIGFFAAGPFLSLFTDSQKIRALGCVVNIILDPIMIFGLFGFPELGIAGAAIATVIGQLAAMLLSFFALYQARGQLHLTRPQLHLRWEIVGEIYNVGAPTILMNSLGSVLVTGLNSLLMGFSETAVSVFGIYYRLQTFAFMPVSGLTQGALPIMAYNYGSRSRSRVLACLRDGLLVSFGILAGCCLLFALLPAPLLELFGANEEMLAIGVPALRLLALSYLPAALGFCIPTLFQAVGRGRSSLVIFLLRQFLITLPLAWLLAGPFGLTGIWLSFLAAESVAALAALIMLARLLRADPILHAENPAA